MAISSKLKTLILLLVLGAPLASAELLSLERDGASEIMARIKATMNAQAAQDGSLVASEFSYQADGVEHIVNVTEPLPSRVLVDGEASGISLYRAQVNAQSAVLVMVWDDDDMMLSYHGDDEKRSIYEVAFSGNTAEKRKMEPEHPADHQGEGHAIDAELDVPEEFQPTQAEMSAAAVSGSSQPIRVYVFKHNDVKESIDSLIHEHFAWWVKQMDSINKRHMAQGNNALYSEIVVDFRTDKGIQSFNYKGNSSERLKELAKLMKAYKNSNVLGGSYKRTKFLLMTEKMINYKTLGVAYVGGQYGIAADDDDQVAAHELGHMFNGRHENADIIYNGWWCETILYWQHVPFRSSCHRYTDANKDTITNYLR
ncbi:hypothetical protein [Parendozoicomonas haliclonae]|uniref:Uncharacterized protein n=1 Tax=Parendozoicomonas haliclonae TaxID=1960125 RepID=A0A1X7AN96_9GAMM|nr:hypothetical protein [Parendozoicomonas haliclonae]SMA49589.1 hypothetical protein EHSB41UT_03374 [Parendozoicomonas haliclonae]